MANNAKKAADQTVQDVDMAISKSEQFIEKNRNKIMYFFAAVIAVVAIVFFWNHYAKTQNEKAQEAIWSSQFLFEAGDFEQALDGFEAVINQYGSTKAGNLALAYAGLCQKELGNYADAASYLKKYSGNDNVVAPAVRAALGDCYVYQDDFVAAARAFEDAARAADNAQYTPLFLRKAGLAYEAAGDKAGALKVYQQIKANWLETTIGQTIDKYIVRVQN